LAGSGGNLGNGSTLVEVTVSPGPSAVGAPIKVGTYPDAVAVTPNGDLALVANYTSNTVTPISLPSGKALPSIDAGSGPAGIAITPDGAMAYVTDANANAVTPIDLSTLKPAKPIPVGGGPQGIVITPDGSKAFVADAGAILGGQSGGIGHQVTPIDLSTGKALAPINVGNAPVGIAVTADGSTVFVTNLNSESVTPINTASDTAAAAIATDGGPIAVVVAANAAWVVNTPASGTSGNNVQPISVATDRAGRPIRMPKGAQNIALAPDGRTAWVACLNSASLVPIDLRTKKAGKAILVLGGPVAVAVANQAKATPTTSVPTSSVAKSKKKSKVTTTTK
jgi:YVTN family beta-propeller protein